MEPKKEKPPAKSGGGKQIKKMWSKGKQKEKVNNMVLFDSCDKKIVAEVETDVGEITAGHNQNKCIKEQQSLSNTKDTEKEITSEDKLYERVCFGFDGKGCTCVRTTFDWTDCPLLVELHKEPEKPLLKGLDLVNDKSLLLDLIDVTGLLLD